MCLLASLRFFKAKHRVRPKRIWSRRSVPSKQSFLLTYKFKCLICHIPLIRICTDWLLVQYWLITQTILSSFVADASGWRADLLPQLFNNASTSGLRQPHIELLSFNIVSLVPISKYWQGRKLILKHWLTEFLLLNDLGIPLPWPWAGYMYLAKVLFRQSRTCICAFGLMSYCHQTFTDLGSYSYTIAVVKANRWR